MAFTSSSLNVDVFVRLFRFHWCQLLSTHTCRQGADISATVCFCACLFVQLRISLARIKLAASNFARWFIGVLGREMRESPILGNFAPQKPKIGRISHPPGSKVEDGKTYRNRVRFVDEESACVDIRPSPKTEVLVCLFVCLYGYRFLRRGWR